MTKFAPKDLPSDIQRILDDLHCPALLVRHLILVYNVGLLLTKKIQLEFPNVTLLEEEIVFGTATHDIGKISFKKELSEKGKQHEQAGFETLIAYGINEKMARFTKTHGNWEQENIKIEDLIVALADKIWKGKRIDSLEEKLIKEISTGINSEYWTVYSKMDSIISEICLGADARLNWQKD